MSLDTILEERKAQYDQEARKLLSNKQILARILKSCVREFKEASIPVIIRYIGSDLVIGTKFIEPDLTNRIMSESEISYFKGEGRAVFDLVFTAVTPDQKDVSIRINVEAQNRFNPGYDLVSRGIFYCARMLSAQAETVFDLTKEEYQKLQKVYSIWICIHVPEAYAGTIDTYRIDPEHLKGMYNGPVRYDLLEVVMVRLGKNIAMDHSLLEILGILFSSRLSLNSKLEGLQKNGLDVKHDAALRKGVNSMCNLSDGIEEDAVERTTRKVTRQVTKQVTKSVARQKSIDFASYLLAHMPQMSDEQIYEAVGKDLSLEEIRTMRSQSELS